MNLPNGGGSNTNPIESVSPTMHHLGYKELEDWEYTIKNPKQFAKNMVLDAIAAKIIDEHEIDLDSFVYYHRPSQYKQDIVLLFYKLKK